MIKESEHRNVVHFLLETHLYISNHLHTLSTTPTRLPSDLRNRTVRIQSNKQLPNLIHHQHAQRKRDRNKPELNRNARSVEDALNTRLHGDEDGNRKRHDHAAQQPRIATFLAEGIRLEDTHSLVAHGEQVTPLHDDEGDKVDALTHDVEVREFGLCVAVEALAVAFKGEEEVADSDAGVALVVEEEH